MKTAKEYEITYRRGGKGAAGAVRASSKREALQKAAKQWGGRSSDYEAWTQRRNPQTKMKGRAKSIRLKNFTGTVRQNPDKTITVKGLNHKAAKKRAPARKRTTARKRKR